MASMVQLNLFDAARQNLRALQMALEGIKPGRASELLQKILRPESLTWELQVLDFLQGNPFPEDLDDGYRLWEEFRSASFYPQIPGYSAQEIQKSYFGRLLAASVAPRDLLVTPGGLSVGYLSLMADRPDRARRCLEEELSRYGDKPATRLHLALANFRMGEEAAAKVHFREALLQGWNRLDPESIPDPLLLRALRGADDPQWAVAEACIEGNLPIACFPSQPEFADSPIDQRLSEDLQQPLPAGPAGKQRQFYRCLVASQNRRWMDEGRLIQARLRMKELHPRLHARHMKSLEANGRRPSPLFPGLRA
ncbi:MAG: hypothetical protein V3T83_22025 [Acidobacteriota bacterium]